MEQYTPLFLNEILYFQVLPHIYKHIGSRNLPLENNTIGKQKDYFKNSIFLSFVNCYGAIVAIFCLAKVLNLFTNVFCNVVLSSLPNETLCKSSYNYFLQFPIFLVSYLIFLLVKFPLVFLTFFKWLRSYEHCSTLHPHFSAFRLASGYADPEGSAGGGLLRQAGPLPEDLNRELDPSRSICWNIQVGTYIV